MRESANLLTPTLSMGKLNSGKYNNVIISSKENNEALNIFFFYPGNEFIA